MIEKTYRNTYTLFCDHCGDECDEVFDGFEEAVEYKKDNGWRSVKDRNGDWHELCPSCSTPEIIGKLKGIAIPGAPRDETDATDKALRALEDI
jgi:hypothetical protein